MLTTILIILSLAAYYLFFKRCMYRLAPIVVLKLKLDRYTPLTRAIGVIELAFIAISHCIFAACLMYALGLNPKKIGLMTFNIPDILFGILIGVGTMAVSSIICRMIMEMLQKFLPQKVPKDLPAWLAISRGGWMRHHVNKMQVLPWFLSALIVTLQIGAEETIFRGILITHFMYAGLFVATVLPALLFIVMQAFQTPNLMVAMFPMVGALVSSVIFSYLYIETGELLPLIVAHLTFFMISII